MRVSPKTSLTAIVATGLLIGGTPAWGDHPRPHSPCPPPKVQFCPPVITPAPASSATDGRSDATATQQPVEPVPADALAQAAQTPEAGPGDSGSFNPQMFGDLIGVSAEKVITVRQGVTRTVRVPIGGSGSFKIAENESPRPQDRVFLTYNFFSNVNQSLNGPDFPNVFFHREVLGFEKTFLDGNASFGMRLPFVQLTGGTDIANSQIADLTFIMKYAFINDRGTGDVLSAGLAVTAPTGEDFIGIDGEPFHSTLIQPWAGYIVNLNRSLYFHGFLSVVVPTDNDDVTLLTNDLGIGWFLRRGDRCSMINSIIPTFEVHVNNPLNHRGADNTPIGIPDWVNLTCGVHLLSNRGWILSTAVGTPITGPRLFDMEAIVQLNYRF